jgi:hypothetical protein
LFVLSASSFFADVLVPSIHFLYCFVLPQIPSSASAHAQCKVPIGAIIQPMGLDDYLPPVSASLHNAEQL